MQLHLQDSLILISMKYCLDITFYMVSRYLIIISHAQKSLVITCIITKICHSFQLIEYSSQLHPEAVEK